MHFPFKECLVPAEAFSLRQFRNLLPYPHAITLGLIDLRKFEQKLLALDAEKVVMDYLSPGEGKYLKKITSAKRRKEWLAGRFAARYYAVRAIRNQKDLNWFDLAIIADKNGRPFVAADTNNGKLPDISISHSGDFAAVMAVARGLCGIDLQKVSRRVIKVQERFCIPDEERILKHFFASSHDRALLLTTLWAAKEALRKVANSRTIPGFLELELTWVQEGYCGRDSSLANCLFTVKSGKGKLAADRKQESVVLGIIEDYALALTTRNDTAT